MKKIIITICTLAIIVVGVCIICSDAVVADAAVAMPAVSGKDTITVVYGDYSWSYVRDYSNLTVIQQLTRAVGAGSKVQYSVAEQLIASGYSRLEAYNYILPRLDDLLASASVVEHNRVDALVEFSPSSSSKFTYHSGSNGIAIDIDRLVLLLLEAGHGDSVVLPTTVDRAQTIDDVRQCTAVCSTYSTSYSYRPNRIANIRRACQLISGSVVNAGQSWSFNDVVGERSEDNGFAPSTVIIDGVYGDGIGGGVCQVSTTLYNALLLADISITKVCQHTLVPSYIEPSFDAMVSYPYADLAFVNNGDMPIYIDCTASNSGMTVTIYGQPSNIEVVRRSQILERQPYETSYIIDSQLYPQLIYSSDTMQIVSGSDGVTSIGYVDRYDNGILIGSSKGRKCTYAKVDRVIAQGAMPLVIDDFGSIEQYNTTE